MEVEVEVVGLRGYVRLRVSEMIKLLYTERP